MPTSKLDSSPEPPSFLQRVHYAIAGILLIAFIAVSGIVLLPTIFLALILSSDIGAGTPLDMEMGGRETTHTVSLPDHTVEMTVFTTVSGDNGDATIEVKVDDQPKVTLHSNFNYDLWTHDDPGRYWLKDVDGDRTQDLVMELNTWIPESYYISGADGRFYPYETSYQYPRSW